MFVGHFGVAFAAKRMSPRVSLATLLAAASFLDILWPIFLLLGWETARPRPGGTPLTSIDFVSYPWSHSLVMAIVWGVVVGGLYWFAPRARHANVTRDALVVGALVFSHWPLDYVVHLPDLPLTPTGATLVGLGLWNSMMWTIIVESLIFLAGLWLYAVGTRATSWKGQVGWWGLVALLVVVDILNLRSPPPSDKAVDMHTLAIVALIGTAVMLLLARWGDRNRVPTADHVSSGGTL